MSFFNLLCFSAPPQRREQLRPSVHFGEDGPDPHRQTVHDELGSERVCRILIPQSGICAARLNVILIVKDLKKII
jgi:hypothetical protein